ncbi:MAG: hypoxanthine-guanine phosphoribosyltransferase [Pseudomonadota bacterium]
MTLSGLSGVDFSTVVAQSDVLYDAAHIEQTYQRLAADIDQRLGGRQPVVVPVLMGGMIPTAGILRHLRTVHALDAVQTSRYGHETTGGALAWKIPPSDRLAGQTVVVIDDIFDQGKTLEAIIEALTGLAADVMTVVLARKRHDRVVTACRPDFVGVEVPDRFVFGCGLDYHGGLRHLPDLHAIAG